MFLGTIKDQSQLHKIHIWATVLKFLLFVLQTHFFVSPFLFLIHPTTSSYRSDYLNVPFQLRFGQILCTFCSVA